MSVAEWEGIPLAEVVARLKPSKDATGGARQRLRSHRPEFAALDRRRQLGVPARRSRQARRVPRHPDEWRAGACRSRQARPPGRAWLVRLLVDQVGQRDPPRRSRRTGHDADGGVREPHASERRRTSSRATTRRPISRPPPRRCASRSARRPTASNTASSASCGAAPSRSIGWRFASRRTRRATPFAVCPAPKTHTMWSLWEYRWKPTAPGTYDIALEVPDQSVPQRRLKIRLLHAPGQDRRGLTNRFARFGDLR